MVNRNYLFIFRVGLAPSWMRRLRMSQEAVCYEAFKNSLQVEPCRLALGLCQFVHLVPLHLDDFA